MTEVICSIEVPETRYDGDTAINFHRIRLSAIEGVRIIPWYSGTGREKTEERGSFVNIMFQNWAIHCQMNDPGVTDFMTEYNHFGYKEVTF